MNILVPDSWLREYLKTDATPKQIKEYLSLCGPSVERMHTQHDEIVYDIEITGNRPDAMSIMGVAREAATILPRFGISAELLQDPYNKQFDKITKKQSGKLPLRVITDKELNPRWTSVIFDQITLKSSPTWLKKRLELVGVRPLNNVIDITNYLMHAYGQPAHVFDYDKIKDAKMILRASRKDEQITTLDGKTHTLPGNDIVIEDGSGKLIDLCGIMGGENSAISETTKRIVLFIQTYNPVNIRKTSMALGHRTEAAGLFEKGTDTELVYPVFCKGIELIQEIACGKIASTISDIYPDPYVAPTVRVLRQKADRYIGKRIPDKEIKQILTALGCQLTLSDQEIIVTPPSYRRDIAIDVDVMEELARIYGYHNIVGLLPASEPPSVTEDPILGWEQKIKEKLSNWGYTEVYTYSLISETWMDTFHLSKEKTYRITNPLSSDWVYMRPTLLPSMLSAMKQNIQNAEDLKLFELAMVYDWRKGNLPDEQSTLIVAVSGGRFGKLKGLSEAIFLFFGIPYPHEVKEGTRYYDQSRSLRLGNFGVVGEIHPLYLKAMGITKPITVLELSIKALVTKADTRRTYVPIPKYPASYEDIAFIVPPKTPVGPMMAKIKTLDPLIKEVTLFDSYKNIRTFHIVYQSSIKNLSAEDVVKIREKILHAMKMTYNATLKTV